MFELLKLKQAQHMLSCSECFCLWWLFAVLWTFYFEIFIPALKIEHSIHGNHLKSPNVNIVYSQWEYLDCGSNIMWNFIFCSLGRIITSHIIKQEQIVYYAWDIDRTHFNIFFILFWLIEGHQKLFEFSSNFILNREI